MVSSGGMAVEERVMSEGGRVRVEMEVGMVSAWIVWDRRRSVSDEVVSSIRLLWGQLE